MAAKLDYSKWDKEITDMSLSSRMAAAAIEARTGDKITGKSVAVERGRRGLVKGNSMAEDSGADGRTVEQSTEQAHVEKPTRPDKETVRSTLAGVTAVADPQQVETARGIVGELLNIDAVAVALGCTRRTVLIYVKNKRLKAVKIGAVWKISPDNLRKFIKGE
ncbi:hypothetical protein AGMMS50276_31080 [Synergistales bacterium]|nr:hypothetical protein AGMMS50276_31080 [Synergistales bacterium]